jgi:hypothetical protein
VLKACGFSGGTHGSIKRYQYPVTKSELEKAVMAVLQSDSNVYRDTIRNYIIDVTDGKSDTLENNYYNDGTNYLTLHIKTPDNIMEYTIRYSGDSMTWANSKISEIFICYIYDGKGRWFAWAAGIHTQWTWVKLSDASTGAVATFAFNQGLNELQMAWLDDNVQVDRILITNDLALVPAEPIIASQIVVFPNPIADKFTIQYTSPVAQQAQVSLFDQVGTLIMQTMVAMSAGPNNIVLGTDNIYNGIYNLVFIPADGNKATTRIVIYR